MKTQIAKHGRRMHLLSLALIPALVPILIWAQGSGDQAPNQAPNQISSGAGNADFLAVPLSHPSQPAQVKLNMLQGNVTVHGSGASNQVVITATGGHLRENTVPAEARGMRRLTQPELSADEDNNTVTIHTGFRLEDLDIRVPYKSALMLRTTNGNIEAQKVSGELDVQSTNGAINLDQVGGSIVAYALNGQLTANVTGLDSAKPSSFSTLNGRIDLTLPPTLRANLAMRSDQGDIYMDQGFDFKTLADSPSGAAKSESRGMVRLKLDNTIRGAINGGGVEINIRTFNGSVLVHRGNPEAVILP